MRIRYGKIIIGSLVSIIIAAFLFVAVMDNKVQARTVEAHTLIFRGTYTNPYVVLVDKYTGDVVDKTLGTSAATNDWTDDGALEVGSGIAQHGYSDFWVVTLPPLSTSQEYILCIGDNATPVETDTLDYCGGYSPETKCVINDGNPYYRGQLLTR